MSDVKQTRLNIAIVGGGIGGLTFAVALAKSGAVFDVDIYESTSSFSEIGAGLNLWPRVQGILKTLGLGEDLKNRRTQYLEEGGRFTYFKADQAELVDCGQTQDSLQSYHRADMLKILEENIPSEYRPHFNKRLVSYEDSAPEPVMLHFADGSSATCDILIGADGIKSAVRECMFSDLALKALDETQAADYRRCMKPTWSGIIAYRALALPEDLKTTYPNHPSLFRKCWYFGKEKSIVTYPVSQNRWVNCAAPIYIPGARGLPYDGPSRCDVGIEELLDHFKHWAPESLTLLQAMKNPTKWAVYEVKELPTFVSGRVAILGDAAHAMTPHLASGAGQAIEDSITLAAVLARTSQLSQGDTSTVSPHLQLEHALRAYDEVRRPFAQRVQELSYRAGQIMWLEFCDAPEGTCMAADMKKVMEDMHGCHTWFWDTNPQDAVQDAVRKLDQKLGSATQPLAAF